MAAVHETGGTGTPEKYSYSGLERDAEAALLRAAMDAPEFSGVDAPFCLLTIEHDSPLADIARGLERQVFDIYFGNDANVMAEEYAAYESRSLFFLLVDKTQLAPAGVSRVMTPQEGAPSKSFVDITTEKCTQDGAPAARDGYTATDIIEQFGFDKDKVLDVATIAVSRDYSANATNSTLALGGLMRALYTHSVAEGMDLVAIIDALPLSKLEAINVPILRPDQKDIVSPFEYLGAKGNTFIGIRIRDVEESVSALDRGVFDFVFGAGNLGGSVYAGHRVL